MFCYEQNPDYGAMHASNLLNIPFPISNERLIKIHSATFFPKNFDCHFGW